MRVSGSNILIGNIITSVTPQIDQYNYLTSLVASYTPATNVQFVSDALDITTDVSVYIDRSNYTSPATIKLNINPYI